MPKMNIRKGDRVRVLSGKDKGKCEACVPCRPRARSSSRASPWSKAQRPTQANQQAHIEREAAIDVSNVALTDPETDRFTRVGYRFDENGKKVRYPRSPELNLAPWRVGCLRMPPVRRMGHSLVVAPGRESNLRFVSEPLEGAPRY